jgi:hypothetical protein
VIAQCNPAFRVWPDEKCERCEKHGLPCGPNISCKESRVDSAAHGSGSPEVLPEDDEHDLIQPNSLSFENLSEQAMRQAKLPSQQIHNIGQPPAFEESNTVSPTSSGPYSMGFLSLTPNNNLESSRIQSNVAIIKSSQRADELQERCESFPTSSILPFLT